jgi:hypothetical protein
MLTLLSCGQGQNSSFDADYQAVLNRAVALGYTLPSASQRIKQNTLVLALKSGGIWTKLDVLYIFANDGGSNFGTLNWKAPTLNQATLINSPTFTNNQGFTGNGTSSYINTNFNPATQGVNYTLNNASRHNFVRTQSITASTLDGVGSGNSNATVGVNTTLLRINQGATSLPTSADYSGSNVLKSIHRTSVSNVELFVGTTQTSRTFNSTTVINEQQLILARGVNVTGSYGGSQVSMYSMGANLVAENTAYVNAFNTYITSL